MFLLSFPLSLLLIDLEMLSMCLLFCFVLFWIFCCVVCGKNKNKNVDNKKKEKFVKSLTVPFCSIFYVCI